MKEFWTSVARTHLALIATSMLLFALAITPDESRYFDKAEAEALQLAAVASQIGEFEPTSITAAKDANAQESMRIANALRPEKIALRIGHGQKHAVQEVHVKRMRSRSPDIPKSREGNGLWIQPVDAFLNLLLPLVDLAIRKVASCQRTPGHRQRM